MNRTRVSIVFVLFAAVVLVVSGAFAAENIVIGHPACLSEKIRKGRRTGDRRNQGVYRLGQYHLMAE